MFDNAVFIPRMFCVANNGLHALAQKVPIFLPSTCARHIEQGDVADILEHPNQKRYPGQRVLAVVVDEYAYLVPCIETEQEVFLKTIIPSRKATKKYWEKSNG